MSRSLVTVSKTVVLPALLLLSSLNALTVWVYAANDQALFDRAAKSMQSDKAPEAIKLYEKVLQQTPTNQNALLGLATAYYHQGNAVQALNILNRLTVQNNSFAPAYFLQGEIQYSMGNKADAKNSYLRFKELAKGTFETNPEILIKLRQVGL